MEVSPDDLFRRTVVLGLLCGVRRSRLRSHEARSLKGLREVDEDLVVLNDLARCCRKKGLRAGASYEITAPFHQHRPTNLMSITERRPSDMAVYAFTCKADGERCGHRAMADGRTEVLKVQRGVRLAGKPQRFRHKSSRGAISSSAADEGRNSLAPCAADNVETLGINISPPPGRGRRGPS